MENVMMSPNQRSSLCYSTDYNNSYIFNIAELNKNIICRTWGHGKDKKWRPVSYKSDPVPNFMTGN